MAFKNVVVLRGIRTLVLSLLVVVAGKFHRSLVYIMSYVVLDFGNNDDLIMSVH